MLVGAFPGETEIKQMRGKKRIPSSGSLKDKIQLSCRYKCILIFPGSLASFSSAITSGEETDFFSLLPMKPSAFALHSASAAASLRCSAGVTGGVGEGLCLCTREKTTPLERVCSCSKRSRKSFWAKTKCSQYKLVVFSSGAGRCPKQGPARMCGGEVAEEASSCDERWRPADQKHGQGLLLALKLPGLFGLTLLLWCSLLVSGLAVMAGSSASLGFEGWARSL